MKLKKKQLQKMTRKIPELTSLNHKNHDLDYNTEITSYKSN
jgi:hypothetical protein